ncbi:DNA polymerase III, gamma/tau subunit [Nitzschia inconspicua]|uniref:DNA polymerase III, gamma/tau subunit n=1 Tax=Nitzschia inconspicua TaxID=303405 RepID=A0A9K3LMD6_9STRA|nr:DNA polymerase III, gamma/tau subunit [Nitzschia inconspicua]
MEIDKENNTNELTNKPSDATSSKSTGGGDGAYQVPWIEKYRPQLLQDIVGNEETLIRLQAIARDGNLPNLILCGPPGTGKTTSVHALARELLGKSYKDGVLELNASDARGIDVVRNRIKSFAMNKVTLPPGRHKIIILDEADSMTTAAQQALRRTMEIYSNSTRFCLACNVSTKIIEAIQSRAAILRYTRLTHEQILSNLLKVCQSEKVPYTEDGLEAILFTAEGDMRHALNNLQAANSLAQSKPGGMVNQKMVFQVCDQPHPTIVRAIVDACDTGNLEVALAELQKLWNSGYAASDIIGTIFKVCKAHNTLPEGKKLEYLREIGFTHMRISNGVNTLLQLMGLVSRMTQMTMALQEKGKV